MLWRSQVLGDERGVHKLVGGIERPSARAVLELGPIVTEGHGPGRHSGQLVRAEQKSAEQDLWKPQRSIGSAPVAEGEVFPQGRALELTGQTRSVDGFETVPEAEIARELGVRVAIVGDPKNHATKDLIQRVQDSS